MASWMVEFKEWYARQHPAVKVLTVLAGGAAAAATGVVAAPAVGAALSALGFGVAGGTLTGAAASSAGLASLAGGSIASGGLGVAGGTAVVATVAGAAGAGAATHAARQTTKEGETLADLGQKAQRQQVSPGGIRFEG